MKALEESVTTARLSVPEREVFSLKSVFFNVSYSRVPEREVSQICLASIFIIEERKALLLKSA